MESQLIFSNSIEDIELITATLHIFFQLVVNDKIRSKQSCYSDDNISNFRKVFPASIETVTFYDLLCTVQTVCHPALGDSWKLPFQLPQQYL